jgi:hypothetical protein
MAVIDVQAATPVRVPTIEDVMEGRISMRPTVPMLIMEWEQKYTADSSDPVHLDFLSKISGRRLDTYIDHEMTAMACYMGKIGLDFPESEICEGEEVDEAFGPLSYKKGDDILGMHVMSYIFMVTACGRTYIHLPIYAIFKDKECMTHNLKHIAIANLASAKETFGMKFDEVPVPLDRSVVDVMGFQALMCHTRFELILVDTYDCSSKIGRKSVKCSVPVYDMNLLTPFEEGGDLILNDVDFKEQPMGEMVRLQLPVPKVAVVKPEKPKPVRDKPVPVIVEKKKAPNLFKKKDISAELHVEEVSARIEGDTLVVEGIEELPITPEEIEEYSIPDPPEPVNVIQPAHDEHEIHFETERDELNSCKKKYQYKTKEEAEMHLGDYEGRFMRSYHCLYCGFWHNTSTRESNLTFNGGKYPTKLVGPLGEQYVFLLDEITEDINDILSFGWLVAVKRQRAGYYFSYIDGVETKLACRYWRMWRDVHQIPFRGKSTFFYEVLEHAVRRSQNLGDVVMDAQGIVHTKTYPRSDEEPSASQPESTSSLKKDKYILEDVIENILEMDKSSDFKLGAIWMLIKNEKEKTSDR